MEKSRLNMASRLRGEVAGGREERRWQEDQVRSRSRATWKSWECVGKKKAPHEMAEFYRKERLGEGKLGEGKLPPGLKRFRVQGQGKKCWEPQILSEICPGFL